MEELGASRGVRRRGTEISIWKRDGSGGEEESTTDVPVGFLRMSSIISGEGAHEELSQ